MVKLPETFYKKISQMITIFTDSFGRKLTEK